MKLLIVTDAWHPQVNGVVRTLEQMRQGLIGRRWQIEVLGPRGLTVPCPSYAEIRLSLNPSRAVRAAIRDAIHDGEPTAIHIATEGPLGMAARSYCLRHKLPFSTSFHTRFPEYLKLRYFIPRRWTYRYLQAFHRSSEVMLVPSASIRDELFRRGFTRVQVWGRGVNTDLFHPKRRRALPYRGPVQLYVGRVAIEKNLEAFLNLPNEGTKIIVGDGPAKAQLQARYPEAVFLGPLFGKALADIYASADVFVFPSLTDTFGLVLLEALASGLPVAAFRVPGPVDVITDSKVGVLIEEGGLAQAIAAALNLDRMACRQFGEANSWQRSVEQFEKSLVCFETKPRPGTANRIFTSEPFTAT